MIRTRFSYVMFIMTLLFISCTDISIPDNTIVENNQKNISVKPIKQGQVDISLTEAQTIAQLHMKKQLQKDITPYEASSRSENNIIVSQTGKELAHIVNFQEGGYCIISANKKNIPILAYSDHGIFSNNTEDNLGLEIWKEEIKMQFEKFEELSESEVAWINRQWMEYENIETEHASRSNSEMTAAFNQQMSLYRAETGRTAYPLNIAQNYLPAERYQHFKSIASSKNSPEEYTIIEIIDNSRRENVGPLLTTEWHQEFPFNSLSGIDAVGCYPIAACQIMSFHEHPAYYNWNNIKYNNYLYYNDAAKLIADFRAKGNVGNSNSMSDVEARNALKAYGYTTSSETHNGTRLYSHILDEKEPVCLTGFSTDPLFDDLQDGHAWVCDGVTYTEEIYGYKINWITYKNGGYVYETDGITYNNNGGTPLIRLHYNWGWGPGNQNGWYYSGVTQPTNSSYNFRYGRENIFISLQDN